MVKKKTGFQETAVATDSVAVEEKPAKDLKANMEEVKTYEGVIGYILRNSTSATIDLKDSTKIIDYAILSSSALDTSEKLCELFDLGEVANIMVRGEEVNMLALTIGENRISIFMEKNANCEEILKKLHSIINQNH